MKNMHGLSSASQAAYAVWSGLNLRFNKKIMSRPKSSHFSASVIQKLTSKNENGEQVIFYIRIASMRRQERERVTSSSFRVRAFCYFANNPATSTPCNRSMWGMKSGETGLEELDSRTSGPQSFGNSEESSHHTAWWVVFLAMLPGTPLGVFSQSTSRSAPMRWRS